MLIRTFDQEGFSLIELMVAIVLVGILSVMGVQSFNSWVQNQQTRVAAETILSGTQIARAEAVKRNVATYIDLCGLPNASWQIIAANAAAASAPAQSLACPAAVNVAGEERIQERSSQEGSRFANIVITPNLATRLTFNGMGRVAANADGSATITQIDVNNPRITGTDAKPLRITIGGGGSVRMCDPSATLAVGDPRRC